MAALHGWQLTGSGAELGLVRRFEFPDFHHTMAFANAVAWVAHTLNHHPEISLCACSCTVRWSTHDVGGLTRLDLEAAARVNAQHASATQENHIP